VLVGNILEVPFEDPVLGDGTQVFQLPLPLFVLFHHCLHRVLLQNRLDQFLQKLKLLLLTILVKQKSLLDSFSSLPRLLDFNLNKVQVFIAVQE
jgi:hypothetical protein